MFKEAVDPEIKALIEGYRHFRARYFDQTDATFTQLVREGQRPKILMVACSDSRVDPALVLNCQPGDLFVIRNVANIVPPYENDQLSYHGTSAALEFGICVLGVSHVILLGHTQCGGIQALLENAPETCGAESFLTKWMELAKAAHEATENYHSESTLAEKTVLCGQYSLINSLKNLQTFPWIAQKMKQGLLHLHAWNFDLSQGILEAYDVEKNRFGPLETSIIS